MPKSKKRKRNVVKGPTRSKKDPQAQSEASGSGKVDWGGGRKSDGPGGMFITFGGIAAVLVIAAGVWFFATLEDGKEFTALAGTGKEILAKVESFPNRGRNHLTPGQTVNYGTRFPTSGDHDPFPTAPGFYTERQPLVRLVHALEHGNIVIHYDKPSAEHLDTLKHWSGLFRGTWDGLVLNPSAGLGEKIVLTAWRKRLQLDQFDPAFAAAFIDEYRGRGPERRVR